MKTIQTPLFDTALCLNLGSAHASWLAEIPGLLDELTTSLEREPSAIPFPYLRHRLKSISYFCLTDALTLSRTREVVIPHPNSADSEISNNADDTDPIEDWSCEDASWDKTELGNEIETDWDERPDSQCRPPWEGLFNPAETPDSGCLPESNNNSECHIGTVSLVVDCYGLYVTSIRLWAQSLGSKQRPQSVGELLNRIEDGSLTDGPAVLLCPENICEIPAIVASSVRPEMRRDHSLAGNPLLQFLRLVLLHEIGHHVFPLHCESRKSLELSEAMANWFVYRHVNPSDRLALHLLSETQDHCYRMYQGMLPLLYPRSSALISLFAGFPSGCGSYDLAWKIERRAFNGPRLMAEPAALPAFAWDGPFWHDFMHFGPLQTLRRACSSYEIHPADIMAVRLLRDSFGKNANHIERAVRMFRDEIGKGLQTMPGIRQFAWHQSVWAEPPHCGISYRARTGRPF